MGLALDSRARKPQDEHPGHVGAQGKRSEFIPWRVRPGAANDVGSAFSRGFEAEDFPTPWHGSAA